MTGELIDCGHCAAPVGTSDRFCESCGGALFEVPEPQFNRVAIPRPGPAEGPCADCGNDGFSDGFCTECGHRRAVPDRDETVLGVMALVTDRGLQHARNEDAAAAGMLTAAPGRSPALAIAVCDGVSTSGEPQIAAVAASKAGVEGMLAVFATEGTTRAAVLAGLAQATTAAAEAGRGVDPENAPSCTYTAAALIPNAEGAVEITVGSVGDSRAYWLPDPPAEAQQLTVDDSVAQELMTAGAAANSEFVLRGAHTITRWLGADSEAKPWSDANVQTITVVGPGSLLLCSDGLWNYLPEAADIARFCVDAEPAAAARALTEYALQAGGNDNITVAVIPIGGA
ncbi:protein phosphatase 2C domain-containing protein [Mycolicibacterium sp.]|uniref:PP2C family protein-serine/threonine phosphatase n=1 Tax=Mycolicibacterium sp. TaxID=2320850 RepID=UPI001A358357|nr:protein phosphatase 2C domain-containing protein [Mycolicibacterium sp.]MBJ7338102.1 protein phosphatase 2C domain-containing protein [Mycolicibacterium sp.]